MCLAGVLRNAAKATVTAQIGGVTAADVAAAAAAAAAQQQGSGKRGSAPPGVLLTAMPLAQRCYGQAGGESFRCPIEDVRKHYYDSADTANFIPATGSTPAHPATACADITSLPSACSASSSIPTSW